MSLAKAGRIAVAVVVAVAALLGGAAGCARFGNRPPTVSAVADQRILEDQLLRVTFEVHDRETPADRLTVTAASSNPALMPSEDLRLEGGGNRWTLVATPKYNRSGVATITITASDGQAAATASFKVTVEGVTEGLPTGQLQARPGESGFPGHLEHGRVTAAWNLGGPVWLIEETEGLDRLYLLWNSANRIVRVIVGQAETSRFERVSGRELIFTSIGGYDTGMWEFPYTLAYDLATGEYARRPLFLPVRQDVSFGKPGWRFVLAAVTVERDAVTLEFRPKEGEVLAGGDRLPPTRASYAEQSGHLVLTLGNVDPGAGLKTGQDLPPQQEGGPVTGVSLAQVSRDLEVRIKVPAGAFYSGQTLSSSGLGYERVTRYRLTFRPGETAGTGH